MAQAAPKTTYDSLNERLDKAREEFYQKGSVNDFLWLRLESDIKKLIDVNAPQAYDLLSQLHVLKNDLDSVRKCYLNSVNLDKGKKLIRVLNFHASLTSINRVYPKPETIDEAAEVLNQAYEIAKDTVVEFSYVLYSKLYSFGFYESALKVATMLRNAGSKSLGLEFAIEYDVLEHLVNESKLPIQHCVNLLSLGSKFMASKGITINPLMMEFDIGSYTRNGAFRFLIGIDDYTNEELVGLQFDFDLLKAEYDIEHDVNTYEMMYVFATFDEVDSLYKHHENIQ